MTPLQPIVTLPVTIADAEEMRRDYLASLARGGLRVRTPSIAPVDSAVQVQLSAPGHATPLVLGGRVVEIIQDQSTGETLPVGMEIRFLDLSREQEHALAALLAEYDVAAGAAPLDRDGGLDDAEAAEATATLQGRLAVLRGRAQTLQAELDTLAAEEHASRVVVERLEAQRLKLDAAARAAALQHDDLAGLEARHAALTEELRQRTDAALRQATEEAEQAYVLQSRQADALERQADALAEELAQQLAGRRQRVGELAAELTAQQEQASAAARATQEEVETIRERLRAAKRAQAERRSAGAAAANQMQEERRRLEAQLATARKQLAARQAANAELVAELDRAAARHERLLAKRRDLERLLGLLPQEGAAEPSGADEDQDLLTGVDVEIDDPSEPTV